MKKHKRIWVVEYGIYNDLKVFRTRKSASFFIKKRKEAINFYGYKVYPLQYHIVEGKGQGR